MIGLIRISRSQPKVYRIVKLNTSSIFARNLVGWWPMGNRLSWGSDTLYDMSGNGNHGTLTSMNRETDWMLGHRAGLKFDGVNDFVDIGDINAPIGAAERSITLWFNTNVFGTDVNYAILSYAPVSTAGREFDIFPEDNAVSVRFRGHRMITPKNALSLNTWYHVVVVIPSGASQTDDVLVYIDGRLQSLTTEAGTIRTLDTSDNYIRIGQLADTTLFFNGTIDDVRIYDRALSSSEINLMYLETVKGGYGSLIKPRKSITDRILVADLLKRRRLPIYHY